MKTLLANIRSKNIAVSLALLFIFSKMLHPDYLYSADQSCCGYTMQSGYNNYVCGVGETHPEYIGNCVWWAVYKRPDLDFMTRSPDTSSNPDYWVNTAISHGYTVSKTPKSGAIVVYDNNVGFGSLGHVAYVESVSGSQYTVTEMGYDSWNCVRTRTRTAGAYSENYIYENGSTPPPNPDKSDLVIDSLTINKIGGSSTQSLTLLPNQQYHIDVYVKNQGDGDVSDSFKVKYLLSTDNSFSSSDTSLGTSSISSLDSGHSSHKDITVNAPSTPGTYYIGAWADSGKDIDEDKDSNNFSDGSDEIGTIIVTIAPIMSIINSLIVGDDYSISTTTDSNNGTVVCKPKDVGYGGNIVCTITPATGFDLLNLFDNNVDVTSATTGNSYYIVNVSSNHSVRAVFQPILAVKRISGQTKAYHATLQDAASHIVTGDIIQGQTIEYSESLDFNLSGNVAFKGGYSSDFTSQPGYTTVKGKMTVSKSVVTADMVIIK